MCFKRVTGCLKSWAVDEHLLHWAVSDYKQSLQFQNLNEEKQNIQIEVVRGGRRVPVSIFDVVVGDVVPLKIGDQVPADGILISGQSLALDESSMTGESKIVHKDSKSPFLMSGCKVADGYGTMLVVGVGINTEWGLLMASITEDNGEETPLQVRLNGVATFIGIVGLTVALAVLIVLMIRFFTGHTYNPDKSPQFVAGKTKVGKAVDGAIKIFTVAVTIVVVAVPEGLPLAVTLTLAYSMRKMMADKALVRRLSACETMGSATTICSDKTGTLTLNQMTVVEAYVSGKKIDPPDDKTAVPPAVLSLLHEAVGLNTTGSVFVPQASFNKDFSALFSCSLYDFYPLPLEVNIIWGGAAVEISGSPTEKAILQWGINLGMNFDAVRSEASIIHAFPFNSEKKRGGVAVKLDSEVHLHWKGAAEIVLSCCTSFIDENGSVVPLGNDKMSNFKEAIGSMAASSLRCVAIAYRPYEVEKVPAEEEIDHWEIPEGDLVLLAVVGIKMLWSNSDGEEGGETTYAAKQNNQDPCRPGVRDSVQLCIDAGVKVRMVTGDNLQTAKAIALECGILRSDADAAEPNLIEGKRFRALSEEDRKEVADKISVMGRSSPNDKLLLVQALRSKGHVVAVTGDGTNDAPALHEADIGLAMGIAGTEVAKESSDIIILDDNFASVVKVVRWGRSVYANIQKFIQFQLTVNVAALIINVVAAVSAGDVPLNAVQLLWVNLIMDTLGALALATEPPTDHLMHRAPVGRREPLVTNIMWRNLLIQALYQVTVLLVLNFRGREILHLQHETNERAVKVKNTLIFNAFVLCQVFNEFNARKPDEINVFKGVHKNRLFVSIVGLTVVLQVIIIFFLGKFTSTVRLSWQLWLVSIGIGMISWPLAALGKLIPVPEKPFGEYFSKKLPKRRKNQQEYYPPSFSLEITQLDAKEKDIPLGFVPVTFDEQDPKFAENRSKHRNDSITIKKLRKKAASRSKKSSSKTASKKKFDDSDRPCLPKHSYKNIQPTIEEVRRLNLPFSQDFETFDPTTSASTFVARTLKRPADKFQQRVGTIAEEFGDFNIIPPLKILIKAGLPSPVSLETFQEKKDCDVSEEKITDQQQSQEEGSKKHESPYKEDMQHEDYDKGSVNDIEKSRDEEFNKKHILDVQELLNVNAFDKEEGRDDDFKKEHCSDLKALEVRELEATKTKAPAKRERKKFRILRSPYIASKDAGNSDKEEKLKYAFDAYKGKLAQHTGLVNEIPFDIDYVQNIPQQASDSLVEKANEGYTSDNGDPPQPRNSVLQEINESAIVTLE
ncbi:Calcium-transporting ATPase 9, plasma membrane-type [Capsicum annuum]|nr:Calcium-transporting ATPase 9, plasma membrane-type [Capsicum annuum]